MQNKHEIDDVIGIFKYNGKTYKKVWDDNSDYSCNKCDLYSQCNNLKRGWFENDDPCQKGFHYEEHNGIADVPSTVASVTPNESNLKSNTACLLQQKANLERQLHKLLSDFERDTGLICRSIDFSRVDFVSDSPYLLGVKTNVSLP